MSDKIYKPEDVECFVGGVKMTDKNKVDMKLLIRTSCDRPDEFRIEENWSGRFVTGHFDKGVPIHKEEIKKMFDDKYGESG